MGVDGDHPFPDDPFPTGQEPWPPDTVRGCIMAASEITSELLESPNLAEEVGTLTECLFKAMRLLDEAIAAVKLLEGPTPPLPVDALTRYRLIHDP